MSSPNLELRNKASTAMYAKKASVSSFARAGFGSGSKDYDNHRPRYPKEALDFIVDVITTETPSSSSSLQYLVLELGAGTGIATEGLSQRLPKNTKYLATEPSSDFLGVLQSKALPVETTNTAADKIQLGESASRNIVCVNSFHWFCDDQHLQEMHRVLIPGGKLIIMGKFESPEGWLQKVEEQRREVFRRCGCPMDLYYPDLLWLKSIDSSPLFSLSTRQSLKEVEHLWTLEKYLAFIGTMSGYKKLPEREFQEYLNDLRKAISSYPNVDPNRLAIPFQIDIFVYTSQKKENQ